MLIKNIDNYSEVKDWDKCPTCRTRAKNPITGEFYTKKVAVLNCKKCGKNFVVGD